jgi:hypothetical protein
LITKFYWFILSWTKNNKKTDWYRSFIKYWCYF